MRSGLVWLLAALLPCCGGDAGAPADARVGADGGGSDAGCAAGTPTETTIDVGEVMLRVIRQGCGPRLVLLHGFPEFSFSWDPLVAELNADHELVTVDQRGYGPSEIPAGVADYEIDHLVADVVGLIGALGPEPVVLVAHDWGGIVAWVVASQHPELLRGLVIINAPHPDVFTRELANNPDQNSASQYMNFFIMAGSEDTLAANNYQGMIGAFNGLLTPAEEDRYRAAWAQPGTLVGGLNWYRANILTGPVIAPVFPTNLVVTVPTLVAWGTTDQYLLVGNLDGLDTYVGDLTVQEFPASGHWIVYQEAPALALLIRGWVAGL